MPSSNRLADAAIIAPYLTHHINHHGQHSRGKTKPKQERRPGDEPRFNVGSPRFRSQPANTRSRRQTRANGRPGRRDEFDDLAIPDYPPPSFLEAISTPVTGSTGVTFPSTGCTAQPGHGGTEPLLAPPLQSSSPPLREKHTKQRLRTPPQSLLVNPPDSDSSTDDSSLEVVELDSCQNQLKEDHALDFTLETGIESENRRRIAQASIPSTSSHDSSQPPRSDPANESRSRPGRGILDSDTETNTKPRILPAITTAKKRPLRVFSLSPAKPTPERILSTRPSGSPYSFARTGSQFLRSTTSLCKLPLSNSAPSVIGSESTMSRKMFPSKGKYRVQDASSIEPLDSWEIVDSDQPESPVESPRSSKKFLFPRLVRVPSFHRSHDRQTPRSPSIDTLSHSQESFLPASPTESTPSREDKFTQPSASVLHRQVRRASPPPRLTSFTPASSLPVSPISTSPSIYSSAPFAASLPSTKLKSTPPSSWIIPGVDLSPAIVQSRRTDRDNLRTVPALRLGLPRASDACGDHVPETPVTPSSAEAGPHCSHAIYGLLTPSPNTTSASMPHFSTPPSPSTHRSPNKSASHIASTQQYWSSMVPYFPFVSEPTKTLHHYPGRPLPRAPPLSIKTGSLTPDIRQAGNCPEGLLIDFDGDLCTNDDQTSTSIKNQHSPCKNVASCTSSEHFRLPRPINVLSRPENHQTEPFSVIRSAPSQLPTVSAFNDTHSPGFLSFQPPGNDIGGRSDSDTLRHHTILIERLSPLCHIPGAMQGDSIDSGHEHRWPVSASVPPGVSTGVSLSSSLAGRIVVERRRVTMDGRVKLKLSLLGLAVDRCWICLSQFKGGELATLREACSHVFHTQCLQHWMERSRTCPLCRLPWDHPLA